MKPIDTKKVENTNSIDATHPPDNQQCRIFKRRWLMLFLFGLYSANVNSNWIQYSIISNIVTDYYHVSPMIIEWTSLIFMVLNCPLTVPASWMLQNKGLKASIGLGAFLLFAGSLLKVFSVKKDYFILGFTGQTLISVSAVFTMAAATFLAAVWFPSYQVSTATALGVLSNQVGTGIGFLIPQLIVKENLKDRDLIGQELYILFLGNAIVTTSVFLLILVFFEAKPPSPPSIAQKLSLTTSIREKNSYRASLTRLATNLDFGLLLICLGMLLGTCIAYQTLLNEFLASFFPAAAESAGRLGAALIIGNIVGLLAWGIVLDKTQLYKYTAVGLNISSMIVMVLLVYSLYEKSLIGTYVTSAFFGFFTAGFVVVGFQWGTELTYPVSEAISTGVLAASMQLGGVIITLIIGALSRNWGAWIAGVSAIGLLFLSVIICSCIRNDELKRSTANRQSFENVPIRDASTHSYS